MKPAKFQTDAELDYNRADINAAISAMPETDNLLRYMRDRAEIIHEQQERVRKRCWRRAVAESLDPLTIRGCPAWKLDCMRRPNAYRASQARTGMWLLGYATARSKA